MTGLPQGTKLVLASASPRRLALLKQIGLAPDEVDPSAVDESASAGETARELGRRLARAKAEEVAARHPGAFVIGADTLVVCGRRILPKTEDEGEARRFLQLLSGRRHVVLGAVAILTPDGRLGERLVETRVTFKRLEASEIAAYLASQEWRGKAGGYAIQGRAAAFVRALSGSYSNVVGLPLYETNALLRGLGYNGGQMPGGPDRNKGGGEA